VGLVGRNGSGKSTILQIISGILEPNSGECVVNGRLSALLELGAGFNPEFTGKENIFMNAAILGLKHHEIEQKYDAIVSFSGISEEFLHQPVKTYSSGMYVRLAFAIATAIEPQILVVDEALAVGDEAFQKKCFDRIHKLKEQGSTILFVSHSAGTILQVCTRALLVDGGEIIMDGSPKQIIANYHKLIFAPAEKQAEVREAIKAHSPLRGESKSNQLAEQALRFGEGDPKSDYNERLQNPHQLDADLQSGRLIDSPLKGEWESLYNPALIPETTVIFESHGVVISNPRIETRAGERVNMLRRGGEYIFAYDVAVESALAEVCFGMAIKTGSGVELGGLMSNHPLEAIASLKPGENFTQRFKFSCVLNAGTYFMNCGCSAVVKDERTFAHRIIDAAMFKVIDEERPTSLGMVDFSVYSHSN
jgi:lipopolysaccharide transport system ATP-binding protein